jgi:hypothetical protein
MTKTTTIEEKIKDIASNDWHQFLELVGEDTFITMKVRLLRKNGKTYQQIMIQTGLSMMQVRHRAKSVKK